MDFLRLTGLGGVNIGRITAFWSYGYVGSGGVVRLGFAETYKSYGLATVRYPVLEVEARVEAFDNKKGFSLRVMRAGKPRLKSKPTSK